MSINEASLSEPSLLPSPYLSIKGTEFLLPGNTRDKNCPVKIVVSMSCLYSCCVYVMQVVRSLKFDWDCTILCGVCTVFVVSVTMQTLSLQLLIKRGWGLGTRLE